MNTKCLVNEKGFITTNEPLFLCKWNGGDIVEIHTRLTLYATYKDTGLYDTGDGWSNFESINDLLDHLSFKIITIILIMKNTLTIICQFKEFIKGEK